MRELWHRLESVARARPSAYSAAQLTIWVASSAAAMLFAVFAVARHRAYQSTAYDFGFFDQVVWNTSNGDWFQTSFVEYNFLGQHFEPILLVFAGFYRLGAGPESMLLAQSLFAGAAAIPLFYATTRISGSPGAGITLALAYLLNPGLHRALDFDFHPEVMAYPFVFTALYFAASLRPAQAVLAILPVLLLKEDMAFLVLAFAAILWAQRHRKHAAVLGTVGLGWIVLVVFVLMPAVRGGESDLTERYSYLTEDTRPATVVPIAAWRGGVRLATATAGGAAGLEASLAGVPLLHPASLLAAVPAVLNGLADHPQQSRLDLQYGVAPLALSLVAAAFALGDLTHRRRIGAISLGRLDVLRMPTVLAGVVMVAAISFLLGSPFSPRFAGYTPDAAHRQSIAIALEGIPPEASISSQGTLLPHLSQRKEVSEFPDLRDADYVIIDRDLPITDQARAAGFDTVLETLHERGYSNILVLGSVRVYRRDASP